MIYNSTTRLGWVIAKKYLKESIFISFVYQSLFKNQQFKRSHILSAAIIFFKESPRPIGHPSKRVIWTLLVGGLRLFDWFIALKINKYLNGVIKGTFGNNKKIYYV